MAQNHAADEAVVERFLRYTKFDTQSVRGSSTTPSSLKQLKLAEAIVEDLKALGVENAEVGRGGVVYASIPASPGCEAAPAVGFIAHMDTSPDASGENVKAKIIRFEGKDVVLNAEKNIVFSTKAFPEIMKYAGEDVIFTDGTTLLGADDKAGVAAVMGMAAAVLADPSMPHAKLCIGFTPDEEVARGTESFDIEKFGAAYAYTFDGDEVGALENENFNAATASLVFEGVGVHPGSAKDKMVNSLRYAAKFIDMLPPLMSPECTSGHEGFVHPQLASGSVVKSTVSVIIRDHDRALFEEKKAMIEGIVDEMRKRFPKVKITLTIKDSYYNMKQVLDKHPKVVAIAREAFKDVGIVPVEAPIRGGTDGARLTYEGLPCPNIFTGGMNFHGVYECLPVKSLLKCRDVAVAIAKRSAQIKTLE